MPRGPLPKPGARRTNPPTIPTTQLPAAGRVGRPPKCPYVLGKAGRSWWKWAWATPQAAAWDPGALYALARRAQLEDLVAALDFTDELDLADLFETDDFEAKSRVEWALSQLKRSATGAVALMKEMRELDNRMGLNPKAMADLRWTIVSPAENTKPVAAVGRPKLRAV